MPNREQAKRSLCLQGIKELSLDHRTAFLQCRNERQTKKEDPKVLLMLNECLSVCVDVKLTFFHCSLNHQVLLLCSFELFHRDLCCLEVLWVITKKVCEQLCAHS